MAIFFFSPALLFAQVPNITYAGPQAYPLGAAITNLTPGNTGGAVTAAIYSTVSTMSTTGTSLNSPESITADAAGNFYVADYNSNVIRKINTSGVVSVFAGSGTAGSNNGTGTGAQFNKPAGIVIDPTGHYLYVADFNNSAIRKIEISSQIVTTPYSGSPLNHPKGVCFDNAGNNLYIANYTGNNILKVAVASGSPAVYAGTGGSGSTNSTLLNSKFNKPIDLGFDGSGNLFILDQGNNSIREIASGANAVTMFANGFSAPGGFAFDGAGNIYVGDAGNELIKMVTPGAVVTTLAGKNVNTPTTTDGVGTAARFQAPNDLYISTDGVIYVADFDGGVIRKIAITGYTISPTLPAGLNFDSSTGTISGTPTAEVAASNYTVTATNYYGTASTTVNISTLVQPSISYSPATQIYPLNTTISTYSPNNSGGSVGTFSGYGTPTTISSTLSTPYGIGTDAVGNIYVANSVAGNIAKFKPDGTPSTALSTPGVTINNPVGIVFDSQGNYYILNRENSTTSKVYRFKTDGSNGTAIITNNVSYGIAIDASDNLYVTNYITATTGNSITKYGNITGTLTSTAFSNTTNIKQPTAVKVDASGNIFVSMIGTGKVIKYTNTTVKGAQFTTTTFGTTLTIPLAIDRTGNIGIANTATKTVYVYNAAGTTKITSFTLTGSPLGLLADNSNNLYVTYGNNLVKYTPNGGYAISPTLPTGLSFSTTTGNITGKPTVESPATTYTISAYNVSGSSTTTINITCTLSPPILTYAGSPYSYPINTTISPTITVTNTGSPVSGSVSYNASTNLAAATVSTPLNMAFDAANNVYLANTGGNNILEYDANGGYVGVYQTVTSPKGIVFDAAGNCYVLTSSGTTCIVKKYSAANTTGTTIISLSNTTGIGLANDISGNLYVLNLSSSTYGVSKFDSSGGTMTLPALTKVALSASNNPTNITVTPDGTIYVLLTGLKAVYAYDGSTGKGPNAAYVNGLSTTAYGLTSDGAGNIYVGDSGNNKINIYYASGASNGSLTVTGNPRAVGVDNRGIVYSVGYSTGSVNPLKFVPTVGYFVNSLPAGLILNDATGEISGKPTISTPATDYTVTGWNSAGPGSTKVNINVYDSFTWTGASNNTWTDSGNWLSSKMPAVGDRVTINSNSQMPTIPIGGLTIGSMIIQTTGSTTPSINISNGATLTVTGDIEFQPTKAALGAMTITGGTGSTLIANNLKITNNNTTGASTASITANVPNVKLSGNLLLTSKKSGANLENAKFTVPAGNTLTLQNFQTVNVAGTTSTLDLGSGATVNFTGADALSSLSVNGTNNITGINGATIGYTGTNNQVVYTDAAITNFPTAASPTGISYNNIAFGGSGIKTPAGDATNTLTVAGDFTNNLTSNSTDTYVDLSNPKLKFTGGSTGTPQKLAGGSGVGTTLYSTEMSGNGKQMSGKFNVDSQSALNFTGTSTTTLDAAGALTLLSDVNGSASIGQLANSSGTVTGVMSGTVNVQRYMTGNNDLTYRGYRLMSSPVYDATSPGGAYFNLSYLRGFASDNVTVNSGSYFTSAGGQGNGFDASGGTTAYFYRQDAIPDTKTFTGGNFAAVTKINNSHPYIVGIQDTDYNMPVGNGYMFFYRGNNGTTATTPPQNLTFDSAGPVNQGHIVVKPWHGAGSSYLAFNDITDSNDPRKGVKGFNLIGNPYPCSIDWNTAYDYVNGHANTDSNNGIYAPGTDQTIYIYNPQRKAYGTYLNTDGPGGSGTNDASNIIPSGQAFFVRATNTTAQIMFNETAKVTGDDSQPDVLVLNNKAAIKPHPRLRLQLAKDDINKDETLIILNNKAHKEYVQNEDALYLAGSGVVSLSNISGDNKVLAITQVPVTNGEQTIPLKIYVATQGTYTLNPTETENIPNVYDVWLKDAYTKDSLDLRNNTSYSFKVTADTASTGSKRLSVVLRINSNKAVHLLNFSGVKNTSTVNLDWKTENEGDYTTYVLQRSVNAGKTFATLDSLTSATLGSYNDLDPHPAKGTNLYRLKQIDVLGNISYSNTISFTYTSPNPILADAALIVYPNPARTTISLTIKTGESTPGSYKITVTNNTGIVMQTGKTNQTTWTDDVSRLLPGTYFIQVVDAKDNRVTGRTSFIKL